MRKALKVKLKPTWSVWVSWYSEKFITINNLKGQEKKRRKFGSAKCHRIFHSAHPDGGRRSWNSTCSRGRKELWQKGHVVFKLESSAVQPAMISSSYTSTSQERHWEQLDISTYGAKYTSLLYYKTLPWNNVTNGKLHKKDKIKHFSGCKVFQMLMYFIV